MHGIAAVFAGARRLGAAERARYLDQACAGDAALRREVESLLAEVDGSSPIHSKVIVQGLRGAALAAAGALGSLPGEGGPRLPWLEARSVVQTLDPEGRLGSGVRLRDLEDEEKLPELSLGVEKYRLLGLLGEGGMGTVYLAYDQDLGRRVALKVMKLEGKALAARFLEEAKVLGQLAHPNIVPVYEVGLTEGKQLYYTMPVVRGRSLRDVLEALRRGEAEVAREWSLGRRVQALIQVGQAVSYAHDKGVVHRDLKPANVMVGAHGEVQVLDWGLSQLLDAGGEERGRAGLPTGTGQLVGMPWYMSPEQARGEEVDARSDVWSLGVMFYELLTLAQPFEGGQMEVLAAIAKDEPVAPRLRPGGAVVPLELEEACLRALRKERGERLESAAALVSALQEWLESEADRAKRHQRAEEKAAEGKALLEDHRRLEQEMERLEAEEKEARERVEPWQPAEEKGEIVAAADQVRVVRERLVDTAAAAVSALEKALGFEDENETAQTLLADYYWGCLVEAERAGDKAAGRFHAQRLATYHGGKYARELSGVGSLTLTTDPPGAELWIHDLVEEGFVLVERNGRCLGSTPLAETALRMGSYLVVLKKQGYREVRYPVSITRNRAWKGEVRLCTEEEIGHGFLYVPAGPCLLGGDEGAYNTLPRTETEVGDFFIAEHPVTMGEYLEFLNDLAGREGLEAAKKRAPRQAATAPPHLLEDGAGGLKLPEVDLEGDRWDPRWPAMALSWHDAVSYCEWRSARDGREYRLPSEEEWEKAARGVDGRWYPWGWRFDRSLCNVEGSRKERTSPVAVEEFPGDCSVYGVRGLGGNVRDWTSSEDVQGMGETRRVNRVRRGGFWYTTARDSRAANRLSLEPTNTDADIGFRLAKSRFETVTI